MIRIITGARDSGKSTRFLKLYKEEGNSSPGLYARKLYSKGTPCGYNLVLLPSFEEYPFIILKDSAAPDNDKYYRQGRFLFSKEAFSIAGKHIWNYSPYLPVWIDEIGGLELKGMGYASLLKTILESGREATLTIRDYWLEDVLKKYGITTYQLL